MQINYNVSGSDRKQLVAAIAEYTGEKPKYLGAPDFAFQVGPFCINAVGMVSMEEISAAAPLIRYLLEKGFQAEDPLADCIEEEGAEEDFSGTCISMPRALFTDSKLENLFSIVEAKGSLIRKALGVTNLPIEVTCYKVSFLWFPADPTSEELNAYGQFISKLCDMARNQKRITSKEKDVDNEKYAFRCFLLRLGFIGEEYKTARKILLRNFTGSSAFRDGQRKEAE